MALTDTQVQQLQSEARREARKDSPSQRNRPSLRGGLARHRGGQPHLRLRRLGPQDAFNQLRLQLRNRPTVISPPTSRRSALGARRRHKDSCAKGRERERRKPSRPGQAHELALKGAETDATKRALATFGNPFGLALYDREQGGVSRRRGAKVAPALGPWILRAASGADQAIFEKPSEFAAALQSDERG